MGKKNKNKGFTLIELLIVMVIIGLLAALVGPNIINKLAAQEQKAAKAQITKFETVLDMYRLDVRKYPTTEQGLKALWEKPDGVEKWDGPYLKRKVPRDPWNNPYVYRYPGEHGEYDIISYGADGAPGGEDDNMDIVSWKGIKEADD